MQGKPEIKALTGLRGFAALWVVAFHAFACRGFFGPLDWIASAGYLGVDVFFVLSGFVLALNYSEGRLNFKVFVSRRLARIYPLHAFVLLLMLVILIGLKALGNDLIDNRIFSPRAFIESLLLIHAWKPTLVFVWNGPSWSISAEWGAYLLFPFFLFIANRIVDRSRLFLWVCCCFLAFFLVHAIVGNHLAFAVIAGSLFTEFMAGILAYRILTVAGVPKYADLKAGIAIAILFLGGNLLDTYSPIGTSGGCMPVLAFAVVFWLSSADGPIGHFFESNLMVHLGRISYAIYLIHAPLLLISDYVIKEYPDARWPIRIAAVAAALVAANYLYSLIEEPARKRIVSWLPNRTDNPEATGSFPGLLDTAGRDVRSSKPV